MYGIQPVVLKVQINDTATVNTLLREAADGIEEKKCLPGTPHPSQSDNLAGSHRQNAFAGTTDRQCSLNKLAKHIFMVFTIHGDNLHIIIPSR